MLRRGEHLYNLSSYFCLRGAPSLSNLFTPPSPALARSSPFLLRSLYM